MHCRKDAQLCFLRGLVVVFVSVVVDVLVVEVLVVEAPSR